MATVNLAALFAGAGLPTPELEYPFAEAEGRRWRFDAAWPGYRVAFEREGGTWRPGRSRHTSGVGYARDCEKYNAAAAAGWLVIRCTADQLAAGDAFRWVGRALRLRGWEEEGGVTWPR
jgi:hypothetical protein